MALAHRGRLRRRRGATATGGAHSRAGGDTTECRDLPADLNGPRHRPQLRGLSAPAFATRRQTRRSILRGAKVTLHELASYAQRHPGRALTIHYRPARLHRQLHFHH